MKKKRGHYHHGKLQEAAVTVGIEELERRGHVDFTLDHVAKRLGVTTPALYRHFKGKAALLSAVIFEVFREFARRMDAAVAGAGSPEDKLRAMAHVYVKFALENPAWFRLQFSRVGTEEHSVRHEDAKMTYPALLHGAIGELFDDAPIATTAYMAGWAFAHGVAALTTEHIWAHLKTDAARMRAADGLIELFVSALSHFARTGPNGTVARVGRRKRPQRRRGRRSAV